MIILKNNNITIPRGISPSFVTTDKEISLQKKSVTITKNGVATVTPDSEYDALSAVRVTTDIHPTPKLQNITKTYVENGHYNVEHDALYDGIGNVDITVNVQERVINLQDKTDNIVSNGDYRYTADASYDGLSSVNVHVDVPITEYTTQEKSAVPTTSEQRIIPDASVDALSAVNISAVNYTIDSNIIPANIKKGVSILGVEGVHESVNNQEKTLAKSDLINNTNESVTGELVPDADFTGMSKISYPKINLNNNFTVEFSTPSDDNFAGLDLNVPVAGFDGVSRFSYKTRRQDKTVTPSTTEQTVNCDSGYVGIRSVTVNPVTSAIDSNIIPENIKKGISILGVEGTNEPHVFPMGTVLAQDILSDEPAPQNLVYNAAERDIDGYSNVEIERIAQERITQTITANGTVTINPSTDYDVIKDVNITVNVPSKDPTLQEKTIDASSLYNETKDIITETITPDNDFDGLSKVTYTRLNLAKNRTTAVGVLPDKSGSYVFFKPEKGFDGFLNFGFRINYQEPTVDPSTSQQLIEPSTGYACFKNVTVNPVTSAIDANIKPANIKKGVSILGVEGSLETGTLTNYVPLKYIEYSDNVFYRLLSGNVNLARNFKLRLTYSKSNPYGYPISINNDTQHLFEIFDQANLATTATLRYYDPDNDKSQIVNVDTDYRENRLIDYSFIHFKKSSTSDYYNNEVTLDFTDTSNVEPSDHVYTKSGNNMYAFARYLNGVLTPAGSTGLRIYQIQVMYHIDNLASSLPLMANFIPVIYNGQAGFLETNTKVFSANIGTGTPKYEIL